MKEFEELVVKYLDMSSEEFSELMFENWYRIPIETREQLFGFVKRPNKTVTRGSPVKSPGTRVKSDSGAGASGSDEPVQSGLLTWDEFWTDDQPPWIGKSHEA